MSRSNSTPTPISSSTSTSTSTPSTSTSIDLFQNHHQTTTNQSESQPQRKRNSFRTNHQNYQSFPRHSISHSINPSSSQSIIRIEPSSPKQQQQSSYSNGLLNSSSTTTTTTSLTLHHDSSPASISFDKPSTISFLSDLISNDSISSPPPHHHHHHHKLNRYSLTSSPTVLSSSTVLRPTTATTNPITPSSSNNMPTSPITSTSNSNSNSNSNSTSTNSSILNTNPTTSTTTTVPTPNTSLSSSTRAGPSRSNTLAVPLNHASTSLNNNPRNTRGLRAAEGPSQSLQSSASSQPHPQQQAPPSPSPSRGEPSNGGVPSNAQTGQLEAKVVILGMQGVGKTSIVHRYTTGSFSYSLASTIGASFCTKKLSVDGCKVRLQIWDTAGQERFRSMAPMYYRGANAAILVYDITNQSSFEDIQNWLHELSANMSPELVIQIVGSKADLATDKRSVELEVAYQQILEWTESFPFTNSHSSSNHSRGEVGCSWPDLAITEVSAKDDFGIEDMFLVVTRRLVMRKAEIEELRLRKSRESILIEPRDSSDRNLQSSNPNSNGWCC